MVRRLLRHDDPELPERLPGSPTISSRVERHRHLGRVALHSSEPDRRRAVARGAARARDVTLCTHVSHLRRRLTTIGAAGRARHTAARLRSVSSSDALSLWRGPVLEDLGAPEFASTEAARHDELRLVALDHGIDADLALGQHHAVIPELQRLVIEHPFRERLHCRLILALYRAGRQADALAVSASVRRQLVDELGVDPGAKLRDLETPILRHDPALLLPDARPAEVGIVTPESPVPDALSEAMQPGEPMAVFDTFVRLLTGIAAAAPVVLAFEDCERLDHASGRLLRDLFGRLRAHASRASARFQRR